MSSPYDGQSTTQSVPGISGENTANGTGVSGSSDGGIGVEATSTVDIGLHAIGRGLVIPGTIERLAGQAMGNLSRIGDICHTDCLSN